MDPLDRRPPEVDATQSKPGKLAQFVFVWGKIYGCYKSSRLAVAILEVGEDLVTNLVIWTREILREVSPIFICWPSKKLKKATSKSSSLEVFLGTCRFLQEVIYMKLWSIKSTMLHSLRVWINEFQLTLGKLTCYVFLKQIGQDCN